MARKEKNESSEGLLEERARHGVARRRTRRGQGGVPKKRGNLLEAEAGFVRMGVACVRRLLRLVETAPRCGAQRSFAGGWAGKIP